MRPGGWIVGGRRQNTSQAPRRYVSFGYVLSDGDPHSWLGYLQHITSLCVYVFGGEAKVSRGFIGHANGGHRFVAVTLLVFARIPSFVVVVAERRRIVSSNVRGRYLNFSLRPHFCATDLCLCTGNVTRYVVRCVLYVMCHARVGCHLSVASSPCVDETETISIWGKREK